MAIVKPATNEGAGSGDASSTLNIVYLAYGPLRLVESAVFSALTLLHVSPKGASFRLIVYTDRPEIFRRYGIACEFAPLGPLRDRTREYEYIHRLKILVVADCADRYDGDVACFDVDTYFLSSPHALLSSLSGSRSVLHTKEWLLAEGVEPGLVRAVRESAFDSPILRAGQRSQDLAMWNSGAIGVSERNKDLIPDVLAVCDELYRAYPYHATEQLAWSIVLQGATEVVPADDVLYHYWYGREQVTDRVVRFLRANRRLPPEELSRRAYDLRPEASENWKPPLAIRARVAARAGRRAIKRLRSISPRS
jgi:hypothetical protein